jgi:hypothetical protein
MLTTRKKISQWNVVELMIRARRWGRILWDFGHLERDTFGAPANWGWGAMGLGSFAFYFVAAGCVVTQAGHLGLSGARATIGGICAAVREAMTNAPIFRAFA